MGQWAVKYAWLGWPVFPLEPRGKQPLGKLVPNGFRDATTDLDKVRYWWREEPDANIGFAIPSGMAVVDVDMGPGKRGKIEAIDPFPATVRAKTGGGGWHFFTTIPKGVELGKSFATLTDIDLKAGGKGYVVLPPSVHPNGKRYEWEADPFGDLPIVEMPHHLIDKTHAQKERPLRSRERSSRSNEAHEWGNEEVIPEGKRHETLVREAGRLRNMGLSKEGILAELRDINTRRCMPPQDDDDLVRIAQDAMSWEKATLTGDLDEDPVEYESICVTAADIKPKSLRWLWTGRILRGKLTVIDGEPDLGKSLITIDATARVTTGQPWPDGTPLFAGDVIIISVEDDREDTVVPRLMAAGADLNRVHFLEMVKERASDGRVIERPFLLPNDLPILRREIAHWDAKLVIIDPIMGVLNGKVDSFRDQDVRTGLMTPLKIMIGETDAALIMVRHPNKSSNTNPLFRGGGSLAFTAAARTVMMVAPDPDNPDRRVLAWSKGNLAGRATSLAYETYGTTLDGLDGTVGAIKWLGTSSHTAKTLCAADSSEKRQRRYSGATQQVLDVVRERRGEKITADKVQRATSIHRDAVYKILDRLTEYGELKRTAFGVYRAVLGGDTKGTITPFPHKPMSDVSILGKVSEVSEVSKLPEGASSQDFTKQACQPMSADPREDIGSGSVAEKLDTSDTLDTFPTLDTSDTTFVSLSDAKTVEEYTEVTLSEEEMDWLEDDAYSRDGALELLGSGLDEIMSDTRKAFQVLPDSFQEVLTCWLYYALVPDDTKGTPVNKNCFESATGLYVSNKQFNAAVFSIGIEPVLTYPFFTDEPIRFRVQEAMRYPQPSFPLTPEKTEALRKLVEQVTEEDQHEVRYQAVREGDNQDDTDES